MPFSQKKEIKKFQQDNVNFLRTANMPQVLPGNIPNISQEEVIPWEKIPGIVILVESPKQINTK